MGRLEAYLPEIGRLCELHKVKSLYAFGSVISENFNSKSDVDLLVDFSDIPILDYADNYYDLKFSLEEIFNRPIDLLEEKALKNPFFIKSVTENRVLVYGR